ncbi:lytic transglycosylase domain-containing protein [Vreelandella andesensis]|uniref:Lytic transglycosylase domain-containing protein n=1 Tax=Vreelandella andesensis TaxID=447567 RepID=A0A3S0WHC4_9GAMM|nr:lytic transglycosylase domain-containing protein [Halomonas andesensis]RUR28926.1 lytic transglycosylase domain-containing protein [Halomonas andesensis]
MPLGALAWRFRRVRGWVLAGSLIIAALPIASAESAPLRQTLDAAHQPTPYYQRQFQQWRSRMDAPLSRFIREPAARHALLTRLYQEARLAGLPPDLVLSLIQVESAFKADAISSAGAVGLMQIMPFWVEELGLPMDNLSDPNRNLRYGCTILAHYLAVERGDFTRALARYNGSLGETWYPERVLKAWRDDWR